MIEYTKGSSTCARCKRTGGTQLSKPTKAKRLHLEMLAVVEDMPEHTFDEMPLPSQVELISRPNARPRLETIQETPQRPISLYNNATTSTAKLLSPGDEVFRSLVVGNDQLRSLGYTKINVDTDPAGLGSIYFATLREVGYNISADSENPMGLFHSRARRTVRKQPLHLKVT